MATHSMIFAWRIPLTEKSGGLQYMGLQELAMTEATEYHFWQSLHTFTWSSEKKFICFQVNQVKTIN